MKKKILLCLTLCSLFAVTACNPEPNPDPDPTPEPDDKYPDNPNIDIEVVKDEFEKTYNYMIETTNLEEGSAGYGLIQDRYTNPNMASIAATGFGLASYPFYVEEGLMDKEEANDIVVGTLDTMLRIQNSKNAAYEGCISHFVNMNDGTRTGSSEISTIDTAILVSGAIASGEYFKGEALEKAMELWGNVDFNAYAIERGGKQYISMGVDNPTNPKQLGPWDYYAEQLMIYILGAGNPVEEHRISKDYYEDITKTLGVDVNGENPHYYSWFSSIFTYQFSHAFFAFENYEDAKGINWYENSVNATKAAIAYSDYYKTAYKTFEEGGWGLTACDTPIGYNGYLGSIPRGWDANDNMYNYIIGTVAPCGALGSFIFTPEESFEALELYRSYSKLNDSKFGLRDAYNLDFNGNAWYCGDFVGIDKGITSLMLGNYIYNNLLHDLTMQNEYVVDGFVNNGFTEVEGDL